MKLDCSTNQYEDLYARWLMDPGKILDAAQLQPGERVIDLCGGTGIVAREAVYRGATSAFVVDVNPRCTYPDDYRMIPPFRGRAEEVDTVLHSHVEMLHDLPDPYTGEPTGCLNNIPGRVDSRVCHCVRYTPDFDLVVCRQAIGYLDVKQTALAVRNILRPGGRFVFNAFVKPKWSVQTYKFNGRRFIEASGFFGRTVMHLQAGRGLGFDVTKFRWHREADLDAALRPHFTIQKTRTAKSLTYVCVRTPEAA